MATLLPPFWLIRAAVAAVWFYEGLWCKLLCGQPHELEVVESVPFFGPRVGALFLQVLGAVEVALGAWTLSGVAPLACLAGAGVAWTDVLRADRGAPAAAPAPASAAADR